MKKLTSEELKEKFINNLLNMTEVIQKVELIEGTFKPSDASDMVMSLITEKINFHKLKSLSMREGNEYADCDTTDDRIAQLEDEKMIAREFIKIASKEGCNLKISGTIEISFDV